VASKRSRNYALVTNGVELEHFSLKLERNEAPPELEPILRQGKPIIGYFGSLAQWFDYELVIELAKRRDYEVVLIGYDYDGSMKRYGLDRRKNLRVIGPIPYQRLPRYAHWFDVSMIPFRLNEITESTSPIKLFEYMALGHPIVSTGLPECRKYRSVLIGESTEGFLGAVDRALGLRSDAEYCATLRREALENTWQAKAEQIDHLLGGSASQEKPAGKAVG
jgi:glycosyltransferase involved in cell wall biosynthesis